MTYNVMILEDDPLMQGSLVSVLLDWEKIGNLDTASTLHEFEKKIDKRLPDILLADLDLPDGSGNDAIYRLTSVTPSSVSLVISNLSDSKTIVNSIMAGAVGYLHKDDNKFFIIGSIEEALMGNSPISPFIAKTLLAHLNFGNAYDKQLENDITQRVNCNLSPRELEVLELIAVGMSYEETARILIMSKNTMPAHIRNIYRKLQVNNKAEAVHEARMLGILK